MSTAHDAINTAEAALEVAKRELEAAAIPPPAVTRVEFDALLARIASFNRRSGLQHI
jgi:hypothetical protein